MKIQFDFPTIRDIVEVTYRYSIDCCHDFYHVKEYILVCITLTFNVANKDISKIQLESNGLLRTYIITCIAKSCIFGQKNK